MNDSVADWVSLFKNELAQGDLPTAIMILEGRNKSSGTPRGDDKVKALRAVQALVNNTEESYHLALNLLERDSAAARSLAAMLTATFVVPLFTQQPSIAEEIMLRIAEDSHWEVREDADNIVIQIMKEDFNKGYDLLERWAMHSSENVRRAVVMTGKKAGRERHPGWASPLLDLIEMLVGDRSLYVRKNLGPFVIGDGFLRYYPDLTLARLTQWGKMDDDQVRWNVAMAFSTAEAAKHADAAVPILEQLALDERRYVWRAVASAMRNLGRRVPDKVVPVLDRWLEDDQRVKPAQTALKYI